jgi:parallel beta-helix repeat protein
MQTRALVAVLILAVAISAGIGYYALQSEHGPNVEAGYPAAPHSAIAIGSDSDFTKPGAGSGCECVRTGSGTEADPYLISDWIVNSTTQNGIVIWGTSVHLVIARVELHSPFFHGSGIYLKYAQNVIVRDCRINGYLNGIFTFFSSNLQFINNTVTDNQYGILLEASDNNGLVGNRFDRNGEIGIFVRGPNNILRNNTAIMNGFGGINIDGTAGVATGNQVEGNIVSDSGSYGIGIWRSSNNVLRSNTVTRNKIVGIMLTDHSTNNMIEANTVSDNAGSGIALIDGSSGNTVRLNTVRRNGDGVNDFDLYDAVSGNVWQENVYDTKKPETID